MKNKKLLWYNLALMAFSSVWGFGNIINGFATYGGIRAVIPWLIIFVFYFVPYSLMVGELGSVFSSDGAGVSSWIGKTIGPMAAYLSGWTYWVMHMPYISQKPTKIIVAFGWALFRDNRAQNIPSYLIALISLGIFALAIVMALKGISVLKRISAVAGAATFIMSLMYIIMMFASKSIAESSFDNISWSLSAYKPEINMQFFLSLSILIFAVGGCEKVSPYVNQMKNPSRDFPLGMIVLAIMTSICALLGTIAMGMMFDSNNIPQDLITNGGYYAFQTLGQHYGVGNTFVIIYALCDFISQLSVVIVSIDAPLKMLLDNADKKYIPEKLFKKNKNGIYVNGVKMVAVIVGILIVIPAFGIGEMNELVVWLVKINSVCMPMRYLWVFTAYIALKVLSRREDLHAEYRFIKNPTLGMIAGGWCFLLTAFACILGIFTKNRFELIMNIVVPVCLVGFGFIMPQLAKKDRTKLQEI